MTKHCICGHEVNFDRAELLIEDDTDIHEILKVSAAVYSDYSTVHVEAMYRKKVLEEQARALEASKFVEFRESGKSEKTSDMMARSDEEVVAARMAVVEAECEANRVSGWMQSLRERHENCLNLGYNIRSEMKMIGRDTVKEDASLQRQRHSLKPSGPLSQFAKMEEGDEGV